VQQQTLLYVIDPFDPAGHRIRVTMQIAHPDPQCQAVSLPAWIPGSYLIRDFSKNIETLKATCAGKSVAPKQVDSHSWVFENCKGKLSIEYVIYAWDASVRSAHFDDSHCFFNGTSLFLKAHGLEHMPSRVDILHPPHTRKWHVYTSMANNPKPAKGLLASLLAPNYDDLIDHPVEIGTPQVISFEAHGALHEFVITGHYPNLDLERIAQDTRKICETQIAFFEPETLRAAFLDCATKYVFMLTVTHNGYGGLEHRASTALMYPRRDLPVIGQETVPAGYTDFLGLVSHEYFHTWNVKRIKPAEFVPYPLDRPAFTTQLWIFEGFTSYYDDLMLFRSGILSLQDYLKQVCKGINQVHAGSGRFKQSLAQSSFDAWTKYYKQDENAPNAIVSYYTKGALVALGLDLVIRQKSQGRYSLDDVMRTLWQEYGRNFYQGAGRGLQEYEIRDVILRSTGVDVSEEIEHWVYQANDVPLAGLLDRAGYEMHWSSSDKHPGLDITLKTQDGQFVIRQVHESGAAHKAGLSAHDKLIALAGMELAADQETLKRVLAMHQPGDTVTAHVFRDGVLRSFDVRLSAPRLNQCRIEPKQEQQPLKPVP